jgi:dTDP-4-amino-4,6-dideoxygalactose transaminase
VFSLHATKPFGCGEGGFIVTHDAKKALRYRRMTNFGIWNGISEGDGTNAKMSEYHAAVALAALDGWRREPWLQLHDWYQAHLPPCVTPQKRPRGVYSLMPVRLPEGVDARAVGVRMAAASVETRRWYCPPLYHHPLFLDDPAKFPVTESLSHRLLGLPFHTFLKEPDVETVCRVLSLAIAGASADALHSAGSIHNPA